MKIGRNDPCPCVGGNKYKRCCMTKIQQQRTAIKALSKLRCIVISHQLRLLTAYNII